MTECGDGAFVPSLPPRSRSSWSSSASSAWVYSLGSLPFDEARRVSTTVVDRNGKLLRAYAMADGRWRLPVDAKANVDPTYLKLLFAYEDQRFYSHDGIDPLALGRAAFSSRRVANRVRRLDHLDAACAADGAATAALALRKTAPDRAAIELERTLSKERSSTSTSPSRPMAAISKASAPHRLPISARSRSGCRWRKRPFWSRCRNRRRRAGSIAIQRRASPAIACWTAWSRSMWSAPTTPGGQGRARAEAAQADADPGAALRPTARWRRSRTRRSSSSRWTPISRRCWSRWRATAPALGPNISVGIIVVDNESGDVLARVGSADYFDESRAGQVDMIRAIRSPGSTLKPFVYGLAFEDCCSSRQSSTTARSASAPTRRKIST